MKLIWNVMPEALLQLADLEDGSKFDEVKKNYRKTIEEGIKQ